MPCGWLYPRPARGILAISSQGSGAAATGTITTNTPWVEVRSFHGRGTGFSGLGERAGGGEDALLPAFIQGLVGGILASSSQGGGVAATLEEATSITWIAVWTFFHGRGEVMVCDDE
ncbi:MAG: hypothetical protein M1816_004341 [Peltula sp. TS41687]|nr:MAG: hypothetical protein M1816_004341 [Peltula sp. TS41687]